MKSVLALFVLTLLGSTGVAAQMSEKEAIEIACQAVETEEPEALEDILEEFDADDCEEIIDIKELRGASYILTTPQYAEISWIQVEVDSRSGDAVVEFFNAQD